MKALERPHRIRINRYPGWARRFGTTTGLPLYIHRGCPNRPARPTITRCPGCGTSVPEGLLALEDYTLPNGYY